MSNYQTQLGSTIASNSGAHSNADADLLLRLSIALAARQRAAWRAVRVGAQNGILRLEDVVPTFYDRQLILAVAQHVAGVLRVEDELTIDELPARRQEATAEVASAPISHGGSEAQVAPAPNAFYHLPVLSESLEDILAKRAANAAAAG